MWFCLFVAIFRVILTLNAKNEKETTILLRVKCQNSIDLTGVFLISHIFFILHYMLLLIPYFIAAKLTHKIKDY